MVELFASFLASRWRWPALGIVLLLIIALAVQGIDYASSWLAHRRLTTQVTRTEAAHDARAADEPQHVHHFDSTIFSLAGQSRELQRTLSKIKHLDDSLTHRLHARPALPAEAARQ